MYHVLLSSDLVYIDMEPDFGGKTNASASKNWPFLVFIDKEQRTIPTHLQFKGYKGKHIANE
jgi:hypothetical protein